jgi:hypothetical protein
MVKHIKISFFFLMELMEDFHGYVHFNSITQQVFFFHNPTRKIPIFITVQVQVLILLFL